MKAFVFPGQGAQTPGMGKALYENNPKAKELFEQANEILGFRITDLMFEGTAEDLRQTKVTQPAVFLDSVIKAVCLGDEFKPDMVGGHSLGEFSALTAAGALTFADGLKLVSARAMAMQKCCEANPGAMAAIIGMADEEVEKHCAAVTAEGQGVVIAANYNNPGQLVISGNREAVERACEVIKEAGAKDELEAAIKATEFHKPVCPVYQNVDGQAHTEPEDIKQNLVAQLTSPVLWTKEVQAMVAAGATEFTECGPGRALQGMIVKIAKDVTVSGIE